MSKAFWIKNPELLKERQTCIQCKKERKVLQNCEKAYIKHACQVASVVSDSVRPHGLQPTRLLCPWDSPGKNTGVGCHFLLQH